MANYSALTTLSGRESAEALGEAMESLVPEPTGVGVFEIEEIQYLAGCVERLCCARGLQKYWSPGY